MNFTTDNHSNERNEEQIEAMKSALQIKLASDSAAERFQPYLVVWVGRFALSLGTLRTADDPHKNI